MLGGFGVGQSEASAHAGNGVTGNRFLDLLGGAAASLLPGLESFRAHAELSAGWAVFPAPGTVLARVLVMQDGRIAQAALIGASGLVPGPRHDPLGRDRIQTLIPGLAFRVPAEQFAQAAAHFAPLAPALAEYELAQLCSAWHGLACAALHPVEQRLAHWLLEVASVAGQGTQPPVELPVTQAMLAGLLGLRRTTVTRAMMALEQRGLILHRRSRVRILDRQGLLQAACECHDTNRQRLAAPRAMVNGNSLAT
jgi:hypothetical protein